MLNWSGQQSPLAPEDIEARPPRLSTRWRAGMAGGEVYGPDKEQRNP
jgi:hypothetical protein